MKITKAYRIQRQTYFAKKCIHDMFTKMTIFKIPDLLAFMKVEKDTVQFSVI